MEDKNSDFGRRLRIAFKHASNASIGEQIGVGKSSITFYMQGRLPSTEKLIEISEITGCNLNWLLTGKGSQKILLKTDRPQGIILQGSKGGIGTSISAVLIATTLALKGYGVLLAGDYNNNCLDLLTPQITGFEHIGVLEEEQDDSFLRLEQDYFLTTKNSNLDIFVPRTTANGLKKLPLQPFQFNSSDILKRYQYVIFDTPFGESPYDYPNFSTPRLLRRELALNKFYLKPILDEAQVVVPYNVLQSKKSNLDDTVRFVADQQIIYPQANLKGIFLIDHTGTSKDHRDWYNENLKSLRNRFNSKIFKTSIQYHPLLRSNLTEFNKQLFSRKTKVFSNFSALVSEILSA